MIGEGKRVASQASPPPRRGRDNFVPTGGPSSTSRPRGWDNAYPADRQLRFLHLQPVPADVPGVRHDAGRGPQRRPRLGLPRPEQLRRRRQPPRAWASRLTPGLRPLTHGPAPRGPPHPRGLPRAPGDRSLLWSAGTRRAAAAAWSPDPGAAQRRWRVRRAAPGIHRRALPLALRGRAAASRAGGSRLVGGWRADGRPPSEPGALGAPVPPRSDLHRAPRATHGELPRPCAALRGPAGAPLTPGRRARWARRVAPG